MNTIKITIIASAAILGLLIGCRKSSDVMLSAPTEPPEAILKPALLTATTISPAVEKPINVPDAKEGPTVTVAEGKSDPAKEKKQDDDVLRPATAGLNVTKGSAVDTKNYLHKCVSGDTTESIAAAYGVDEKDICILNGIRSGANLSSGKVLLLRKDTSEISQAPDVTTYTVVPGDTFSKIARTFNIASPALMKMNSTTSSSLQIGDVLYVPHK
ncbi:LysM peptidoglycan-binding domain-containing protein [bacterium]|nr:LysM peptidoglycan-binding domain-containing protein [bacterium]